MITSLSPLDGRYKSKVDELIPYFSEYALIKYRLIVELSFFMTLSAESGIPELPGFTDKELKLLEDIIKNFDEKEAEKVKAIEKKTNHDVKAVEYYIKEKLEKTSLKKHPEFVHFACTSEDINNLAYGLMLKGAGEHVILPRMKEVVKAVKGLARKWRKVPLLSMTHGQPATPTTVGKEFLVFASGLERQMNLLKKQDIMGKLNGASGNFNAHIAAYPKVNWLNLSKKFVQNLGLAYNPYTTQIEPHDYQSEIYDTVARFNTVLLDLDRDMWMYISRGIFRQKVIAGEVGSSTMPHKVNPIDFENSEGNLGMANAMLRHLSEKLPLSRMQRDLTDSTVQRNIGVCFGYSLLAYKSTLKGLSKLELNTKVIHDELDRNWALLAEPIQTVMRKNGVPNAYEKLKELTRGKEVTKEGVRTFIKSLKLPEDDKKRLLKLTPATYIGMADKF
ncbi:adenylosuccinate lyase [Patescibacteria group bacterium]|nr:adenylosuccinate lyase [Patescibacteria group bacterium]MBU1015960.1 adenylosuccinate lyase [Patescibacteria group bacterium]MBU1685308.1 adenylosuccinate lyase [Patescibacteria group bacterium]MBU1939095.1 adenylosuccinate lyase [Patescibacteria group bacterium]